MLADAVRRTRTGTVPFTDAVGANGGESRGMYARAVDDAATRLRRLRMEQWEDFGLGAASFGIALAATQIQQALALPFFLAALFVTVQGIRAATRHFELLEELVGERDAYLIPEVRERALREATLERRLTLASYLRTWLPPDEALRPATDELAALLAELENKELDLDPACAVACKRLLSQRSSSALLDPALPWEDVRSRVRQIRAGFTARLPDETPASRGERRRATGTAPGGQRRFPWRSPGGPRRESG